MSLTRTESGARADVRPRGGLRVRRGLGLLGTYALLIGILVFAIFPFVWTFVISVTDSGSVTTGRTVYDFPASLWPRHVTLDNFGNVLRTYPGLGRAFVNSVIISGLTVLGTLVVSSLAAYPLARYDFRGRDVVFGVILATLVLPTETNFLVNMLTLARVRQWPVVGEYLGVGSYMAVVLPTLSTAFGIFLMRQAFLSVPGALLEAARIDGATEGQILRRVMLPLSVPSLAALGIFTLVGTWNAYFWPSIALTGEQDRFPLAVEMLKLKGAFNDNIFNTAAGAVLMMLPVLTLFVLAQRFFMRGLDGAVK
ncbi:carbohydrate ABC transporter permease [Deinococcus pimensis]|uniref:carbohydrate ABC transporter permease n=1 Tax=Deinococcus pimensis TaxID=309888 RepID=UPI0004B73826|nr:carbohydrate ABC transporter permease [Deinococcus pimensis]